MKDYNRLQQAYMMALNHNEQEINRCQVEQDPNPKLRDIDFFYKQLEELS